MNREKKKEPSIFSDKQHTKTHTHTLTHKHQSWHLFVCLLKSMCNEICSSASASASVPAPSLFCCYFVLSMTFSERLGLVFFFFFFFFSFVTLHWNEKSTDCAFCVRVKLSFAIFYLLKPWITRTDGLWPIGTESTPFALICPFLDAIELSNHLLVSSRLSPLSLSQFPLCHRQVKECSDRHRHETDRYPVGYLLFTPIDLFSVALLSDVARSIRS